MRDEECMKMLYKDNEKDPRRPMSKATKEKRLMETHIGGDLQRVDNEQRRRPRNTNDREQTRMKRKTDDF